MAVDSMSENKENTLEIIFDPIKEIVILQKNSFPNPEDLARFASLMTGGKTSCLYWAENVAFLYFPLTASTEITAKELIEQKKVYWAFLGYSLMQKYLPVIETKERLIVPIIDVSSDSLLRKVAQWIKKQ